MARKAEEFYKEALTLSAEEREELMRLLSMQADSCWASPEIEQAWMEECDRRVEEMDAGRMELIPADEVFRRARGNLSNLKR
jgi:putative addiction module component (TIGR02574 family)